MFCLWTHAAVWAEPPSRLNLRLSDGLLNLWCPPSFLIFAPGMIALDRGGHMAAGTSTNGQTHKVPGYVESLFMSLKECVCFLLSANE